MSFSLVLSSAILLVFHLYLLVRWDKVRRPPCYLVGCAGLAVTFLGNFFLIGDNLRVMIVAELFYCLGLLVALAGAIGACFPGDLPVVMMPTGKKEEGPRPPVTVEKL